MAPKEYDPDDEVDPIELQKEQIAMGKEFLGRLRKQDAAEAARMEEFRETSPSVFAAPPPQTFEEASADIKKTWEEVKKVCPDAPDTVKAMAFQQLMYTNRKI